MVCVQNLTTEQRGDRTGQKIYDYYARIGVGYTALHHKKIKHN